MADPQLQQGIQAAKAGNNALARSLLVQVVQRDVNNEMAWIWMAQVMDDTAQKIDCLKQALRINPENPVVRKAIAALSQTVQAPAPQPEAVPTSEVTPEPPAPQPEVAPEHEVAPQSGAEEVADAAEWESEPVFDIESVPAWEPESSSAPELPEEQGAAPDASDDASDWLSALDDDTGSVWATEPVEETASDSAVEDASQADWLSALDEDAGSEWETQAVQEEPAAAAEDEQEAGWLSMLDDNATLEWEDEPQESAGAPPSFTETAEESEESDWLSALDDDAGSVWDAESSSDADVPPSWMTEPVEEPEPDAVAPSDWAAMLDGDATLAEEPESTSTPDTEAGWNLDQVWDGEPEAESGVGPAVAPFTQPDAGSAAMTTDQGLDFDQVWGEQTEGGGPVRAEPAAQAGGESDEELAWDFDQVWAPDEDAASEPAVGEAGPFTVEPSVAADVEEEEGGLASWASDLDFDLGDEAQPSVSPFTEEPASSQSSVFAYDEEDADTGLIFTDGEPEPVEPEPAAPTGRVSLLDRNRMARFSTPQPADVSDEAVEPVAYAEPEADAEPLGPAPVDDASVDEADARPRRRAREARKRSGFKLLDLRVVLGLLDIVAIPVIAAMIVLVYGGMFGNRASQLAQQVSGACLGLDPSTFVLPSAEEGIGGVLDSDVRFGAGTTYHITQTLVITEGQRVLIEPGAKLIFSPETALEVQGGELYACGNEEAGQSVLFTAAEKEPGGWLGIRFIDVADLAMLSYAEIQFAGDRALYLERSAPVLANVTVANSAGFPISVDGGMIPDLSAGFILRDNPFAGVELRAGTLPEGGVVWPAIAWPYILSGVVKVEADTTLEIQSGAVIKAWASADKPANLWVQGVLKADFVHFTSIYDSREEVFGQTYTETRAPAPGDWTGITLNESSDACELRNVEVRYAGRGRAAVFMRQSSPQLVNVTVADSAWHPLSVDAESFPTFEGVTLDGNATGSTLEVRNGSVITGRDVEQTWEPLGDEESRIVRVVEGTLTVDADAKLTLIPGVVVKFGDRGKLLVKGVLQASGGGADNNRIVLTSVHDDEYGGETKGLTYAQGPPHWEGVIFDPTGEASMVQNTVIRYATVHVNRGASRLVNNRILDSSGAAIVMPPDATPDLQNNIFEGNRINGIAIQPGVMTRNQQWARLGDVETQMVRVLMGDVVVSEGVTLTIASGTVIKADVQGRLIISGGLQAPGLTHMPIAFTSLNDSEEAGQTSANIDDEPSPGDWRGVVVGPNAGVSVNYVRVHYADVGLTLMGDSVPVVEDGVFQIAYGTHALRCGQAVPIPDTFLIKENETNETSCPAQ